MVGRNSAGGQARAPMQMADIELAQGANPDAQALAKSINTSQTAEIATMQQLLQTL